jgi:hypothetical protein
MLTALKAAVESSICQGQVQRVRPFGRDGGMVFRARPIRTWPR